MNSRRTDDECIQNFDCRIQSVVVELQAQTGGKCEVGADKSLDRPTSRYRRTEAVVSLERGVCSCAGLQVFSCYIG